MNILIEQMRSTLKKDKRFKNVKEAKESVTYETGINVFDSIIGRSEDGIKKLGLDAGKILYIIGRSGSGKTTLAQQMGAHMVDGFDQSSMIHFDVENSAERSRIRKLSGWSIEKFNQKYMHINTGVNSETFFSMVRSIADTKLANFDQMSYKPGTINSLTGEEEVMLQPTVILLDSLSSLITKDVGDEEEISGGMTASHNAKINAGIFRRLVNILNEANIILIVINHITDNIDINPMQRKKAQVNYLAQSESVPGGKVPVFLSNTFIKLDPGKKLKIDEDYGKPGFLVKLQIIKSRSNSAGQEVDLVFIPKEGFSNVLTNFEFLTKNKFIGGSGHGYFIETLPNKKFKRKGLEELYQTDKEFAEEFDRYCSEKYEFLLSEVEDIDVDSDIEEFESKLSPVEGEEGLYVDLTTNKYYEHSESDGYYEVEVTVE